MQKRYPVAALGVLLFYLLLYDTPILERSDRFWFDRFTAITDMIRPPLLEQSAALIVEIDDRSLSALGQWPWPRVLTAKLIEILGSHKPAAIAIDFLFPEKDRTSPQELLHFYRDYFGIDARIEGLPKWLRDNDTLLADVIGPLPVVMPLYLRSGGSGPGPSSCISDLHYRVDAGAVNTLYRASDILCTIDPLRERSYSAGFINASEDASGTFRRLPLAIRYGRQSVAPLSLAALLASGLHGGTMTLQRDFWGITATIGNRTYHTDDQGNMLLRFYPRESYRRISAVDLLTGEIDPETIRGKFIFFGATATGLHDRYTVTTGETLPGIYIHATLLENLLNGDLISRPDRLRMINMALSFLSALLTLWMMRRKQYLAIASFFGAAVLLYSAATVAGLLNHLYIATGYFLTTFAVTLVMTALTLAVIGYNQRKLFYERLSQSHQATLDSMVLVAETRDTETGAHIVRTKNYVAMLARALARRKQYARQLDDDFIEKLFHAAPLHDVGKVGIPDNILKKPAKLTFDEYETMKTHTTCGRKILDNAINSYQDNAMLRIARNIAYYHHEKWDGSGYPEGLSGNEIPIEARLMALADVYDALISRRYYKEPFGFEKAEAIIIEGRGRHFDPDIVDTFLELKEEFRRVAMLHH